MGTQPYDSRGFFMLPQAPEEVGYYVYGTPQHGAGQYAHPVLVTVLLFVERAWQACDHRKFSIGNTSLAGTRRLIALFSSHPLVTAVFFNDRTIPGVKGLASHDDHFHVAIQSRRT